MDTRRFRPDSNPRRRGLHFAGSSALKSFGPLMRFVWGAGYAARAVTRTSLATRREPRSVRT